MGDGADGERRGRVHGAVAVGGRSREAEAERETGPYIAAWIWGRTRRRWEQRRRCGREEKSQRVGSGSGGDNEDMMAPTRWHLTHGGAMGRDPAARNQPLVPSR